MIHFAIQFLRTQDHLTIPCDEEVYSQFVILLAEAGHLGAAASFLKLIKPPYPSRASRVFLANFTAVKHDAPLDLIEHARQLHSELDTELKLTYSLSVSLKGILTKYIT